MYSKNIRTPNFIEIRPVGTELFYAGGRTGGPTVGDRNEEANSCFSKVPPLQKNKA
jgi:hypothetical protein